MSVHSNNGLVYFVFVCSYSVCLSDYIHMSKLAP